MPLTAKEAIQKAFDLFDELVAPAARSQINHKLLEELKRENQDWRVVVGFDMGRKKTTSSYSLGLGNESSPIREYRTFLIDGDNGELIEMS